MNGRMFGNNCGRKVSRKIAGAPVRTFEGLHAEILKDFPQLKEVLQQLAVVKSLVTKMEQGALTPAAASAELAKLTAGIEAKIRAESETKVADEPKKVLVILGPKRIKEDALAKIAVEARSSDSPHKDSASDLHELVNKLHATVAKQLKSREGSPLSKVLIATNGEIQDFIMEQAIGLVAATYSPKDIRDAMISLLDSMAESVTPVTISQLNSMGCKIMAKVESDIFDTARYTRRALMNLYKKDIQIEGALQEAIFNLVTSMLASVSVSVMASFAERAFSEVFADKKKADKQEADEQEEREVEKRASARPSVEGLIEVLLGEVEATFDSLKSKSHKQKLN